MSLLHAGKKNTYFYNPAWVFHFISSPLRLGPINWLVSQPPLFILKICRVHVCVCLCMPRVYMCVLVGTYVSVCFSRCLFYVCVCVYVHISCVFMCRCSYIDKYVYACAYVLCLDLCACVCRFVCVFLVSMHACVCKREAWQRQVE